jgi:hypothetical protein
VRTDEASAQGADEGEVATSEAAAGPRAATLAVVEAEREREHERALQRPRESEAERASRAAAAQRMGRAMTDAEPAEMREVARAERLLSEDPRRALALTRAMEAGFPEGRFREERAYLEVMALAALERSGELRERAAAFLHSYPAGLYSQRVRAAIAGQRD